MWIAITSLIIIPIIILIGAGIYVWAIHHPDDGVARPGETDRG